MTPCPVCGGSEIVHPVAGCGTYDRAMAETPVLESDTGLTAADRCDRCGAPAQARVQLHAGELMFCGHHMREHAAALARAVKVPRAL